jgi:hypothetical protein
MDIGKSFAFVFEDKDWIVKILLAAAILLIGILFSWVLLIPAIVAALALAGYSVEITRRVIQGRQDELPEWTDWGKLLTDGLKVIVIGIVYALPIILVSLCLGIPAGLLSENAHEYGASVGTMETLSMTLSMLLSCLSFLYSIALSIVLPAAIGFYVDRDDLGAAFRFGEVLSFVRDNFKTYLLTFVMSWVASLVGSLGALVCGIGWLVTGPYSYMVTGHLYGQAYRTARGQVAPVLDEFDATV